MTREPLPRSSVGSGVLFPAVPIYTGWYLPAVMRRLPPPTCLIARNRANIRKTCGPGLTRLLKKQVLNLLLSPTTRIFLRVTCFQRLPLRVKLLPKNMLRLGHAGNRSPKPLKSRAIAKPLAYFLRTTNLPTLKLTNTILKKILQNMHRRKVTT